MVSTSANVAVKRRILRVATWLDLWAGHLLRELEKQKVELYERRGGLPGGWTDHDLITITFERRDMEELICGMRNRGALPKPDSCSAAKCTLSFDDLVGTSDEGWRRFEAKRLGGLEINYELELGRSLDGQLARLLALEDAIGI